MKDFLTPLEFERFMKAAKTTRNPVRDSLIALLAYRHGFRVSELTSLALSDVDLHSGYIHVRRLKKGLPTNHPLQGDEIRAIRAYLRVREEHSYKGTPYLFLSERGPFTRGAINYLVKLIGERAKLGHVHPHMLRHSTGYALANKGVDTRLIQDFLGHRDIQSTVRYTQTNPERFRNMWR